MIISLVETKIPDFTRELRGTGGQRQSLPAFQMPNIKIYIKYKHTVKEIQFSANKDSVTVHGVSFSLILRSQGRAAAGFSRHQYSLPHI